MITRKHIASVLHRAILSGRISFHAALKIYRCIDLYFSKDSREKSYPERLTRKNVIDHLLKATSPKNRAAWTSVVFPAEILYPFDIYPITLEVVAGLLATLGLANGFLDMADSSGTPNTMCSFHRTLIGTSETNLLEKPSLVCATSSVCDGNLKSFSEAAENQNVPFLFIDVPYEYTKDGCEYLKAQLKDAIRLFEEISGRPFNEQKLKDAARNANEAFRLARRFYNIRSQTNKNLYRGYEVANFAFTFYFLLGSEILVDVLNARCRGFESDSDYSHFYRTPRFSPSAKRIMWLHIVPQYDNELWGIIDNGNESRIVCDEYSSPYYEEYDLQDPLGSIARRLIFHPSNGPLGRRIEHILKIAKENNVDGIIHYSSWGCHQGAGNVQILGEAILNAGYKFLNFSGDPIDERNTSTGQHRTRMEAFLEGA